MNSLEEARRLCRSIGGPEVDVWTLPAEALEWAEQRDRPLAEAARDVVTAWWIKRAQQGEEEAKHALLEHWLPEVMRWCRWNAAKRVDPEDAAHDVMIRAAQRLNRLDRPHGFRPWLWAITWRVLREHARGPWLRRWTFGLVMDRRPSEAPSAYAGIERAERASQVREILQQLSLEERTLLWHAYVDRRTRPEIAELMGLSQGTVNRLMTSARRCFRVEAERRGLEPWSDSERIEL
ncbi:MAG: sigma-70 family RNA polymerase sigma factor [Myxococcota bacterium]